MIAFVGRLHTLEKLRHSDPRGWTSNNRKRRTKRLDDLNDLVRLRRRTKSFRSSRRIVPLCPSFYKTNTRRIKSNDLRIFALSRLDEWNVCSIKTATLWQGRVGVALRRTLYIWGDQRVLSKPVTKKSAKVDFFNESGGVFKSDEEPVMNVWASFSNESLFWKKKLPIKLTIAI